MTTTYEFTSTLFEIEPGEDEEVNPGRYGRQLAAWLKAQLDARGYDTDPVIAEDWGRCIMCSSEPFLLWVGCGNQDFRADQPGDPLPAKEDVVWICFPVVEVPFWKRIFRKPSEANVALAKLDADLRAILHGEPGITLIAEGES